MRNNKSTAKPTIRKTKRAGPQIRAVSAAEDKGARARIKKIKYVLRPYVTGMTPRSQRAIANIREICQAHLDGQYDLEIVDIYQQPAAAKAEQIVAAPTLIKQLPLPLRKLSGDMSNPGRVLVAFGLKVEGE